MTTRESAIIGAFTGVLAGPFDELHKYVEEIMGRPVWTHEMGNKDIATQIKEKARDDFIALARSVGAAPTERDQQILALARERLASDGEVELDEDAVVSEGDENGAYVQGWLWVSFDGTELSKEEEEGE